jgi:hypothetical protein
MKFKIFIKLFKKRCWYSFFAHSLRFCVNDLFLVITNRHELSGLYSRPRNIVWALGQLLQELGYFKWRIVVAIKEIISKHYTTEFRTRSFEYFAKTKLLIINFNENDSFDFPIARQWRIFSPSKNNDNG